MTRVTRNSIKHSQNVQKCTKRSTTKISITNVVEDGKYDHITVNNLTKEQRKKNKYTKQKSKPVEESEEDHGLVINLERTPKKKRSKTGETNLINLTPVTPPKQLKRDILHTPKSKQIDLGNCETPSTLFQNLTLSPNRSRNNNNKKKLFKENENLSEDLVDPCIQVSDVISNSKYRDARKALHSSVPTNMPGRETELDVLKNWIVKHWLTKKSGSLYISGPPGTGKTASLTAVLQEKDIQDQFTKVYVNCTTIKSPKAIYSRISKELNIKCNGKTEKECLSAVENYLKKSKRMILLILDEIDQLESKNQSVLYTIFEWPSKPTFQLLLIGIANALDLTDRILPRLQARCELKPELMHFAPYTKEQIIHILTSRLREASVLEVFSAAALQLLAGKVAAISGDVRRALDIARRVIELIDHSKKSETLSSIENIISDVTQEETKTVELKEVLSVLNNVYGTSQTLSAKSEDSFPLQQKIALCSLILMLRKAKNKDITIGRLHDVYRRVCLKTQITAVDQSEFVALCTLIETRGIIRVSKKKETRLHKVHLEWDEGEVSAVLRDKQLMSTIIQDDSCLGSY